MNQSVLVCLAAALLLHSGACAQETSGSVRKRQTITPVPRGSAVLPNSAGQPPAGPLSQLLFTRHEVIPFLLRWNTYAGGDPARDRPEDLMFQINTLSVRTPSRFVKLGEDIANGKFRLLKYEYRTEPSLAGERDASKLTVRHNATGDEAVIIYNKTADLAEHYAVFEYRGAEPPITTRVTKSGEFVLKPGSEDRYKLLEVSDDSALIQLPSGQRARILKKAP